MDQKSPLNSNFSKAMGYYKSLCNKSNKEIAEALHIPATTISAWNTGRHLPDMDRLQALADYLKAPIDQFFDFTLETEEEIKLKRLSELISERPALETLLISSSMLHDEELDLIIKLVSKLTK